MSSNLPPYSTFRTELKGPQTMFSQGNVNSFGNVLSFTPPGFNQALNVKFPDSRLPVCVACKKNFKTKDMCRVRNLHTNPPWTTAYICMALDETCTDENGQFVDKPFVVRTASWRPFCVMEDFPSSSKTPVCSTCKKTNRTRSFCRDRHKHRKLPWCTVYVLLSTQESVDPSRIEAAPSTRVEVVKDVDVENNQGTINSSMPSPSTKDSDSSSGVKPGESTKSGETKKSTKKLPSRASNMKGDDINKIPESRTMLIQINDDECIVKWLKLAPEDDKGAWGMQPQTSPQHPKGIPPGTALLQSAPVRNYVYPPVAPATVVGLKRDAESTIIETTDPYNQHAMGGYNPATGQPLAPALQHPGYPYGRPGPQYSGHIWPYPPVPPVPIPPPQRQNIPHGYVQVQQQRPISPAPAVNSPGQHIIGGPALSPSVTAGEAAAMRRKKPRREYEAEGTPDSRHSHPSPPPSTPAPIVTQLHHQTPNYSQVQLAPVPQHPPGPPLIHQQPQHPPGQIHQDHQQWIYQQMYQAQLPLPPRMTVHTPESASRKFQLPDESPNNVTMTPGPGDGGDSDSNEFNRPNEL